jgi:hypothetical protein
MRRCHPHLLASKRETSRNGMTSWLAGFTFLSALGVLATFAAANSPPGNPPQEKTKKLPALRWDPPRVDAAIPSLSATPSCSLPDVLERAGEPAEELVDHLQRFIAYEQIRYEQTDRQGMREMSLAAQFDYLVDFGKQSEPLKVHETRTPRGATDAGHLSAVLDKGLPVLALVFYPALQGDYEMRCEGLTHWNNEPVWIVHFRQIKGERSRTVTMETSRELYPRRLKATEVRLLSIKGRAWIAAGTGQVMHLETNLVEGILMMDLQEMAISVDYAPGKSPWKI